MIFSVLTAHPCIRVYVRGASRLYRVVYTHSWHFLPGFEMCWLKSYAIVQFLGWAAKHFDNEFHNLAGMFLHNSVDSGDQTDMYVPMYCITFT